MFSKNINSTIYKIEKTKEENIFEVEEKKRRREEEKKRRREEEKKRRRDTILMFITKHNIGN